ncbi:hypothetical protein LCGC14_1633490 [marine sediment metagenome]|uniref:Uncharacterized protein n=1 Tax=marine sediment metagenome TaxID=412755 RepID=A0A0F9I1Y2_9ZZZZ
MTIPRCDEGISLRQDATVSASQGRAREGGNEVGATSPRGNVASGQAGWAPGKTATGSRPEEVKVSIRTSSCIPELVMLLLDLLPETFPTYKCVCTIPSDIGMFKASRIPRKGAARRGPAFPETVHMPVLQSFSLARPQVNILCGR